MEGKDNIEQLFSEKFEGFSPDVDPSVWNGIQGEVSPSGGASGGSGGISGGILGSKAGLIAGVAIVSTVTGLLIGSQFLGSDEEPVRKTSMQHEQTMDVSGGTTPEEQQVTQQDLKNEIVDRKSVPSLQDEEIKEDKESSTEKKYKITVKEDDKRSQNASAAMDLLKSSPHSSSEAHNEQKTDNKENNEPEDQSSPEVEIKEQKEDAPFVAIAASPVGGYAPLHVSFTAEANYEEILWDFGDGMSSTEPNPAHVYYEIGTYEVVVEVTNPDGVSTTDRVFVEVKPSSSLQIPNVFTPNSDGVNDRFVVVGKQIGSFNMKIFNRSGKLLFESNDQRVGWNGTNLQGAEAEEGTYFYIITAKGEDGKDFIEKGSISLFR